MKSILYIQPFLLRKDFFSCGFILKGLTNSTMVWPIYLDNFLKDRKKEIKSDLLYLPFELQNNKISIKTYKDYEKFASQMDKLIRSLNFEIDNNTIICLSVSTSFHFLSSKLIAKYFQINYPSSIIIFGGMHTITIPSDFYYKNSPIDYIIQGEGELTLSKLVTNQNIKKQSSPKIMRSETIPNLDMLPPIDLSLFEKYTKNLIHINLNLSRGCPYKCNFCIERTLNRYCNKKWRSYSPKRAINELESAIDFVSHYNIEGIFINDPIFGFEKLWLNKFLHNFNRSEVGLIAQRRIDTINEKLICEFHKKNFNIVFGLESCSKKMLTIMNKTKNPTKYLKKSREGFKIIKRVGLSCLIDIVFNHPGETRETYQESLRTLTEILNSSKNPYFKNAFWLYGHFPGIYTYNNLDYFTEKYGTVAHFPKWWLSEETLAGVYCIKPSKKLSLKGSLSLFLDFHKKIGNLRKQIRKSIGDKSLIGSFQTLRQVGEIRDLRSMLSNLVEERSP